MAPRISRHLKRTARVALGHLGLLSLVRPRRFQAYCCGTAKSGTHSINAIFKNYRTAHEVDIERTIRLAVTYLDGVVAENQMVRLLTKRDRLLWLEVDSSLLNGVLAKPMAAAFPNAKFILTIRDAYSWADSCMNHQINVSVPDMWYQLDRRVMELATTQHTKWDAPLKDRGLYPLASYFRNWAAHNRMVLDNVPENRLFVVKTREIADHIADLADFVQVPKETLKTESTWSYAATKKHGVLAQMDGDYVRETAEKYCSELMQRFFPEILRSACN